MEHWFSGGSGDGWCESVEGGKFDDEEEEKQGFRESLKSLNLKGLRTEKRLQQHL